MVIYYNRRVHFKLSQLSCSLESCFSEFNNFIPINIFSHHPQVKYMLCSFPTPSLPRLLHPLLHKYPVGWFNCTGANYTTPYFCIFLIVHPVFIVMGFSTINLHLLVRQFEMHPYLFLGIQTSSKTPKGNVIKLSVCKDLTPTPLLWRGNWNCIARWD